MSLLYWFPCTDGTFKNQGLNNYISLPTGFTVENSGKIGKCIKATAQIDTNIPAANWDFTSSSISFGGWVKIKKDDLEAITSTKTYTSTYSTCGGTLFGRDSYGGLGLRWKTNNIFNDSSLNAVTLYIHIRNSNGTITTSSYAISFDNWTYVMAVLNREKNKLQLYINGILFDEKNCNAANYTAGSISQGTFLINQNSWDGGNGNAVSAPWWINDLRIYNHALSPKEVEEISKGLVLHYKLDKNLSVLNNCYSNPTFNTSSSSGGWNHWGPSGHAGTYSQNTDSQYIYNKANTYSHCVDNTTSATDKYYLCYQSPSFSGGYRSLQFIIKEANGLPITETICRPAWNARDGGAPGGIWSEIIDLSNGFYLCKVNGLSQDGSNNLVGIRIQPGYRIYISEGYLENDREICSDIFNQNNLTTIHDCSGYGNNGTVVGTLDATADSPRYQVATVFNGTDSAIKVTNNNWCSQGMEALTINIWAKASSWSAKKLFSCTETGGFNTEGGSSGYLRFPVHVYTNAEKTSTAYKYDSKEIKISDLSTTDWVMITFVYDTTGTKTYINGELHHTYSNTSYGIHFNMNARLFLGCEASTANPSTPYLDGQESDFRIYATALSAAAIKELYDTSASIDASGNMYARELVE